MSYQTYDTEGFILGSHELGEADMFLFVYTEDFGRVRLLAKGIRFEKSKLRGQVQLFTRAQVQFVIGRELWRLTDARLAQVFQALEKDLFRFQAASAVARFCKEVVSGSERDPSLWQLLSEVFTAFDSVEISAADVPRLLYMFQIKAFQVLGYLPETCPEIIRGLQLEAFKNSHPPLTVLERRELDTFVSRIYTYAASPGTYASLVP